MSKHCPKYGCIVIYADCLECEDKVCKKEKNKSGSNQRNSKRRIY